MKVAIRIILALLALAAVCGVFLSGSGNREKHDLEATRRLLHQQGFKVALAEFDLSTPPEVSRRAAMLANTTWAAVTNQTLRPRPYLTEPGLPLLQPAGTDS